MEKLIAKIKDLHKQATTEKSHFYVASILQRVLFAFEVDRKLFKKYLKEIARLRLENEGLRKELDTRNYACGDALSKLWKEIILSSKPKYGDWEYPGQAYRHIKAEFTELQVRLVEMEKELWHKYITAEVAKELREQIIEMEKRAGVEEIAKKIFLNDKWFDEVENKEACWKLIIEAKKHSGDCTNEAHTCQMCIKEDYFRQATAISKSILNAG